MNTKNSVRRFALSICLVALALGRIARAQDSATGTTVACGKAKVTLSKPEYLTSQLGIVVVEPPPGWGLDRARKEPFYLFKRGETYEDARTLIYINVERMEVPFQRAVQMDRDSFQANCRPSRIRDMDKPELLEQGCESKTQLFICDRKQKPYVDLVTKISIGGLLLNVVLSGDTWPEISRYRKDYEFLLKHLTVIN